MNLRDLHYLVTVADELHFGKAAALCNVSQPTLSMQLKKLEETLGVQLFERDNKHVMLTPIGRDIAARARRTLEEANHIRELAKASRDPLAGEIRMGIFPTLAPYILPSLMPRMQEHFTKLNLLLVEEKTPELIERLQAGRIDCALLAMPVAHNEFASAELFDEPFMLAVSAQHKLAKRKSVGVSDIAQETMLLLEDGHCLREQALEVCHMMGIGEAKNFRATSLETLRHMVAAGNAVTLIPKLAVRAQDTGLRYIPFATPAPFRTIGLYWRKTSGRAVLFEAMAALMRKEYGKL